MRPRDEASPREVVPADVNTPDKIVFGLTGRQLVILGVAGVIGWVLYQTAGRLVPPAVLVVVAIPLAGIAVTVAVGRRDGLGLDAWLAAALRWRRTARVQVPAGTGAADCSGLVATTGDLPTFAPLRLPVDAITPTGVVTMNETTAGVVAAGTVNLGLRTGQEQAALLDGFAAWLNALTAPAQIVVSTQRFDLAPAAAQVGQYAPLLPHPALTQAAADYSRFLRALAETRDPLRRQVLLVVKADPREQGGASRRAHETVRALAALGVQAQVLDGPSYMAALAAAVDPFAPPAPGPRATPDQIITTETWS